MICHDIGQERWTHASTRYRNCPQAMNVGVSGLAPRIVRESRKKALVPISYVLDRVEWSGVEWVRSAACLISGKE
jgi:hypothetical protein